MSNSELNLAQALLPTPPHTVTSFLKALLGDECALYISMLGENLDTLKVPFADHLNEIDAVMDQVTKYLRMYSTRTIEGGLQKTSINETPHLSPDTRSMVANLVTDHKAIIHLLREKIRVTDEESEEVDAVQLMIDLLQQHQKMMKSLQLYLKN